jgi:AcrR family transcriptional regulator
MNEEDKRVIRTRRRLEAALLELSRDEGYDAVTIQEITDRAGINYRTFFRHYDGKDALLNDILQTTLAGLMEVMPPPLEEYNVTDFEGTAQRSGRALYEFVAANSDLFRVLLQSGPAALLPTQELAEAEVMKYLEHLPLGNIPATLLANHLITSIFSFVQWWLDNDMNHSPAEMGDYAAQLIMLPVRRLLVKNAATV